MTLRPTEITERLTGNEVIEGEKTERNEEKETNNVAS